MTVASGLSPQMKMLSAADQQLILNDYANSPDASGGVPTINMQSNGMRVAGPVFEGDDAPGTVGPLTRAQVQQLLPQQQAAQAEAPGALSRVDPAAATQPTDIAAMLKRYMPQDDSQSRYLALASGFLAPTKTGSFGEQLGNVASMMQQQRAEQEKLRAQYAPLIMQQVAAQQAREEQQIYRMEAQRAQQQAQQQLAAQNQASQQYLAQQNQAASAERARENQVAMAERAAAERASRELIANGRSDDRAAQREIANKPPAGFAYGPMGTNGVPTLVKMKGGPADLKDQKIQDQDTTALAKSTDNFGRLATAANQVLNHPGLVGITGVRGMLPNIPGTDAANAAALLETLKSQVGFGVLQDMRNSNPTGGALGAISDAEGKRLEANLAALNNAQSLAQFQTSLKNIVDYAAAAAKRANAAYNRRYGESAAAPPADAPPPPADAPPPPAQDDPLGLRKK